MHVLPCLFRSCLFPACRRDGLEQPAACVVQGQDCLRVAHPSGLCIQLLHSDAQFELLTDIGEGFQLLIRRLHVPVVIALTLRSFGIRDRLREKTRAVEVAVRVEVIRTECIDLFSTLLRDMRVAQVLAHHRAVLGFCQGVIVGMPRAGFGALDAQLLQPCRNLIIDIL
jgi:hypothetical protein